MIDSHGFTWDSPLEAELMDEFGENAQMGYEMYMDKQVGVYEGMEEELDASVLSLQQRDSAIMALLTRS